MTTKENDNAVVKNSKNGSKAMIAIVLVTSLFFVWGLTMNLVNALNSPFGNYLEPVSYTHLTLPTTERV